MISDIFKFSLQGFYQAFNQLLSCQLVTGMVRSFKQEFQYNEVITQADILAVSDGTGLVAAHACAANNLIAGQAELLAASLYPCGEMGKLIGFRFHIV